mgnify:FL=1
MKKKGIIIGITILAIVGAILIYEFVPREESMSNKKFNEEYTLLDKDNVYVYKSINEIINVLINGTGIVYLGFPECPWCQRYVVYLNILAKEYNVKEIYYYNIKNARSNNTKEYQKIVEILKDLLPYDDNGNKKVFVPTVVFVKNGKVIALDDETSTISDGTTPDEYWNQERINLFNSKMDSYFKTYNAGVCTSCNK